MKKILIACLFCLIAVLSFGQEYCYNAQGEKVCPEISETNFGIYSVKLNKTDIQNALQNTVAGNVKTIDDFGGSGLFDVEMDNSNREKIVELVRQWNAREDVIFASPIILDSRGEKLAVITNEVIAMLKSNDDFSSLQKLAEDYQIIDIQLEPLSSSRTYILTLAHNAAKNAMETAIELYHTGLFEYTEANRIFAWTLSNNNPYYPGENIPFTVYPNPVNDILQVETTDNAAFEMAIYSLQGAKMLQTVTTGNKTSIDVSNLSDGIYFLQIYNLSNSKRGMKKIVIKH
jgi:hypothetical protein